MKIEKLNQNSYRLRKQYKGKRYTVIVDHKPTQKEALALMAEEMDRLGAKSQNRAFDALAEEYITSRSAVLSPSTIRGYRGIINALPDHFKRLTLPQIDEPTVQRLINDMAEIKSPKTVRNAYGLISSILAFHAPRVKLHVALPKKPALPPLCPSRDQVRQMMDAITGTRYELGFRLAVYGLRRSEICALTSADLDGNVISINKARVQDEHQHWVTKQTTKTDASTRQIVIDENLADMIREAGTVFDGTPAALSEGIKRVMIKAGLPDMSMHKLRHFFASYAHELGFSDAAIMSLGGWQTDHVMKQHYRHAMTQAEASQRYADTIGKL